MPIEIQLLEGIAAPMCVCDHCGKPITDATDGNVLWADQSIDKKRSAVGPIKLTHKKCNRAFERANPLPPSQSRSSYGLEVFLAYLLDNTKFNTTKAHQNAKFLASIG